MILNKINVDTTKQPIFLGEPLGLQRFDRYKYPIFFDLFNKQLTFFWRPEEINLTLDRAQYRSLEKHEQFIFTRNLLFQTMLDSVVARGVPTFTKHVTNPELEICLNTWGFFENIHSYSYTYIIKNVYPDPSKILDEALLDTEILSRANSVTKAYDDLNNETLNIKEKIYLSLISVNILEAIRFYVSFACAFAFGENKKMIGNADIVKLIRRDESCLDKESEVLTQRGWIKFPELQSNDKVAQYHTDGSVSFVIPNKIINKHYSGKMVSYKTSYNSIDMLLTPDHRLIYLNEKKNLKEKNAIDFNPHAFNYIPLAGKLISNNKKLTDFERLLIALQADGTIHDKKIRNGLISGCHTIGFSLKKKRKIDRLTSILNRLGFEYKISFAKCGKTAFRVKVPITYTLTKNFKDWITDYSELCIEWCNEFIEEMVNWDGSIRSDTGEYYYSSTVKDNTEVVQTIANLCGYKTHRFIQNDNRKETYKTVHRLSILKNKNTQSGQSLIKSTVDYNDNVYCVSVPTGMFLARRNDTIFITGNCHLYTTQNIINILRKENEEGFTKIIKSKEPEAIEMFIRAVNEEKLWASYLFQYGSILGLNETVLHKYIEWLCDSRMRELGLPEQFGTKNPIGGWIEPWMDSSKIQLAPQEIEITNYKIGASSNDISNMNLNEFSL